MNTPKAQSLYAVAVLAMIFVFGAISAASCVKQPGETGAAEALRPSEVATILMGSQALTQITGDLAVADGDFVGCVASRAVSEALKVTADVLVDVEDRSLDEIPAIAVDVAECLALRDTDTDTDTDTGVDADPNWDPERAGAIIGAAIAAVQPVIGVVDMECRARVYTQAGLAYAQSATDPVFAEIAEPDGVVMIPARSVSLNSCE